MGRLREAALFGAIIEGENDTVVMDATEDDPIDDAGEVVDHEIEDGSDIQDHVVLGATTITLRGILTDTPLTAPQEDGRALGMYRSLLSMRLNRERVAVITELRVLEPFVISSVRRYPLSPPQAAIGVVIEGKVVRVVSPERVFLPPERIVDSPAGTRDRASEEQDDGQQGTEPITQEEGAAATQAVEDNRTGLAMTVDETGGAIGFIRTVATGGGGP